mgnify:CR=1 FL=1
MQGSPAQYRAEVLRATLKLAKRVVSAVAILAARASCATVYAVWRVDDALHLLNLEHLVRFQLVPPESEMLQVRRRKCPLQALALREHNALGFYVPIIPL